MYLEFPVAAIQFATDWMQVVYTLATIGVCILAVWGTGIQRKWAGARYTIGINEPQGLLVTRKNQKRVWFFHLKIRNIRPFTTSHIRVCCTNMERFDVQGRWVREIFPERLVFLWAYSDVYGTQRAVGDEAALDLVFVDEDSDNLHLSLGIRPNNVTTHLEKEEKIRLTLGVEVDWHLQRERTVVEISWNGNWSETASEMFNNVRIAMNP